MTPAVRTTKTGATKWYLKTYDAIGARNVGRKGFVVESEDDWKMAVTEEADRRPEVLKHVESLDLSENVGIFVERRAVGD